MIYIRYVTELFWTNDQYLKGILKMKKKILIIVIIIAAVSVTGICLMSRPELLANMSNSYSKQMTTNSDISFSGKAGDRIKFSFRSDIVSGDLNMVLYDSAGNKIDTLDSAKASETFFTAEHSDTYTLAAECNKFIGKYKIFIYRMPD